MASGVWDDELMSGVLLFVIFRLFPALVDETGDSCDIATSRFAMVCGFFGGRPFGFCRMNLFCWSWICSWIIMGFACGLISQFCWIWTTPLGICVSVCPPMLVIWPGAALIYCWINWRCPAWVLWKFSGFSCEADEAVDVVEDDPSGLWRVVIVLWSSAVCWFKYPVGSSLKVGLLRMIVFPIFPSLGDQVCDISPPSHFCSINWICCGCCMWYCWLFWSTAMMFCPFIWNIGIPDTIWVCCTFFSPTWLCWTIEFFFHGGSLTPSDSPSSFTIRITTLAPVVGSCCTNWCCCERCCWKVTCCGFDCIICGWIVLAESALPLFTIMTVLLVALWLIVLDVADVTNEGKRHSPERRVEESFNLVRLVSKIIEKRYLIKIYYTENSSKTFYWILYRMSTNTRCIIDLLYKEFYWRTRHQTWGQCHINSSTQTENILLPPHF